MCGVVDGDVGEFDIGGLELGIVVVEYDCFDCVK